MDLWELQAREAIRITIAAYNDAGDRMRAGDLAGCFTEDGVLELPDGITATGRSAIAEFLAGVKPRTHGDTGAIPRYVHHHVSGTHVLEIARDHATARSYYLVLTGVGLDHWGRYDDRFTPVGERWLLTHRRVAADGFGPGSRFASD